MRLYTAGLPPGLRDSRREEIAADLWEQVHDAETGLGEGPHSQHTCYSVCFLAF